MSARGTPARLATFDELFERPPTLTAEAPGRVNLIGEHTDYNGGYVLPTVIPQRTRCELAPRRDPRVRVFSADVGEAGELREYRIDGEAPTGGWLDYVQGVTHVVRAAGHAISGFDLRVSSTVPLGSGLSSSAALEVSLLRALRAAFALSIDDVTIARLGQRAENDFVGAPVGIMDQMAASLAENGTALFLDTRALVWERVPLPRGLDLVVVSSGIVHQHAGGEYRLRRAECERAAALLGVAQLRDIETPDPSRLGALPEPLGRRARHVITENARVLAAVDAMRRHDLRALGALFAASHASMRDDYEVSVPDIDLLVSLAAGEPDIFGARLTGGGFGGAVVMLAREGGGRAAARRIAAAYRDRSGRAAEVLVPVV